MKYVHIGLEDQARAVSKMTWNADIETPSIGETSTNSCQRPASGTCLVSGQWESSGDAPRQSSTVHVKAGNPCENRGFDAACPNLTCLFNEIQKLEAAGIEPEAERSEPVWPQSFADEQRILTAACQRTRDALCQLLAKPNTNALEMPVAVLTIVWQLLDAAVKKRMIEVAVQSMSEDLPTADH